MTVAKKGPEPSISRLGHQHSRLARPHSSASVREIQLEPMKRILAIQLTGNAKRFESEMALSETKSGALVRYRAEIVPDSSIARIFGGPFVQHETEEQVALLAAEVIRCKDQ